MTKAQMINQQEQNGGRGGRLSVRYMSVTAAAKSKMLLDYMVSCIIHTLVPARCLSFSSCTGKKHL